MMSYSNGMSVFSRVEGGDLNIAEAFRMMMNFIELCSYVVDTFIELLHYLNHWLGQLNVLLKSFLMWNKTLKNAKSLYA